MLNFFFQVLTQKKTGLIRITDKLVQICFKKLHILTTFPASSFLSYFPRKRIVWTPYYPTRQLRTVHSEHPEITSMILIVVASHISGPFLPYRKSVFD